MCSSPDQRPKAFNRTRFPLLPVRMDSEEESMLRAMGLKSMEDLFSGVPAGVRVKGLAIPRGLSEQDVVRHVTSILRQNRSEFYTAYTPYQAELSQGMLQALWEYQSFVCELAGMDAANTSMYDGSTALGEAALMAHRITGKKEIVLPRAIHWDRKAVLRSYGVGAGLVVREVRHDPENGTLDLEELSEIVGPDTAAVYVESPSFFGRFEEAMEEIRSLGPSLLIVGAHT